jgi:hypothetical protein
VRVILQGAVHLEGLHELGRPGFQKPDVLGPHGYGRARELLDTTGSPDVIVVIVRVKDHCDVRRIDPHGTDTLGEQIRVFLIRRINENDPLRPTTKCEANCRLPT